LYGQNGDMLQLFSLLQEGIAFMPNSNDCIDDILLLCF